MDLPFARIWTESRTWDLVISADAGLRFCAEAGIVPDLVVGDFDSADPADLRHFRAACPEKLETFPAEKDETDTELAFGYAVRAGADRITILGGTGSRLDHVLGNIQLLLRGLDEGIECFLVDPHNRIRMIRSPLTLAREEQFGKYVSLIPFTEEVTGLTLNGFVYEVEDFTLRRGTARGVSNEIRDREAQITFSDGILLVIESLD